MTPLLRLLPRISEVKGQADWKAHCLPDLRVLPREFRVGAPAEIPAAASHGDAVAAIAYHAGFRGVSSDTVRFSSPLGRVNLHYSNISHIAEKRADARERYVKMALDTLTGPFEVWEVAFTDGGFRLAYIGCYESKRQMLVSVAQRNGLTLWNFMHCDAKSLNKHRHGTLLYRRYSALDSQ